MAVVYEIGSGELVHVDDRCPHCHKFIAHKTIRIREWPGTGKVKVMAKCKKHGDITLDHEFY